MPTLELATSVLGAIIRPALVGLPPKMRSEAAARLLLAIAIQESDLLHRVQLGDGPARGLWQFECVGVKGVLQHLATRTLAQQVARAHGVEPVATNIWAALASDDLLAAKFARLLLWTDPAPLPTSSTASWFYYLGNWRPGKPHRSRWPAAWRLSQEA